MHPAPSVILFTVLSGAGFGFLACLGLGLIQPAGAAAFAVWALGYGLAVAGLLASTFHLGNPQRAALAFTQWRTSWLSREAWAACLTLLILAPVALSDWLGLGWSRLPGWIGAAMAVVSVACTSMIYAQLRTVPRWNHWTTPAIFLAFAATGGTLLSGLDLVAGGWLVLLSVLLPYASHAGHRRLTERGHSLGTATGLGQMGVPQVFEQPHTSPNYLMREMIFTVGRRHATRLHRLSLLFACLLPLLALPLPGWPGSLLAFALHLTGALVARWLFFAEARHVVGLYYGQR